MQNELIFETFPTLVTNRLNLVEVKQEHLKDIFKLYGDKLVTAFYNVKTFVHEEDGQKYIDWFIGRFKERLGIRWGISLKGGNEIIGTVGFNNFAYNHRASIGYDLQSKYWNHGYITEALISVIDFGFNKLEINRIEAEVMVGNVISEKVLRKLGFSNEGILRQWMYWDNKHFDMIMYSLLKSDFQNHTRA